MLVQLYEETDPSLVMVDSEGKKSLVTLIDQLERCKCQLLDLPEDIDEQDFMSSSADPLFLESEEGLYRPLLDVLVKHYKVRMSLLLLPLS